MEKKRERIRKLQEELLPREEPEQEEKAGPEEGFVLEIHPHGEERELLPVQEERLPLGKVDQEQGIDWEIQRFMEFYPEVRGDDIPPQVWKTVAGGTELLTAYVLYENKLLRARLEAQKHSEENRARSLGSLSAGLAPRGRKTLEQYWDEAW